MRDLVHGAHHRRHVAHLAGAMARARAVRRAAVPWNAHEADVDARGIFQQHMRHAHEGGDGAEARGYQPGQGLVEFIHGD